MRLSTCRFSQLRAAIAFALLASCTGCPAVGVIADKLAGPRPVEALYKPGKTTQLLVVAENYRTPSANRSDSDRLARLVSDELAAKDVALVVSQEKLSLVRDARPDAFNKMSVVDVGKAVGAQQVLYIDVGGVGVGVQQGSDIFKGVGSANVKIIDVAAGEVAFPKDMSDGLPVNFETQMRRSEDGVTPDSIRAETLVGLSAKISRMFYKYQPSDMESIDSGK